MGTRLLNHHIKKGNMVVVMMDLDQNLYSPKQQALHASPRHEHLNWIFCIFPIDFANSC